MTLFWSQTFLKYENNQYTRTLFLYKSWPLSLQLIVIKVSHTVRSGKSLGNKTTFFLWFHQYIYRIQNSGMSLTKAIWIKHSKWHSEIFSIAPFFFNFPIFNMLYERSCRFTKIPWKFKIKILRFFNWWNYLRIRGFVPSRFLRLRKTTTRPLCKTHVHVSQTSLLSFQYWLCEKLLLKTLGIG